MRTLGLPPRFQFKQPETSSSTPLPRSPETHHLSSSAASPQARPASALHLPSLLAGLVLLTWGLMFTFSSAF